MTILATEVIKNTLPINNVSSSCNKLFLQEYLIGLNDMRITGISLSEWNVFISLGDWYAGFFCRGISPVFPDIPLSPGPFPTPAYSLNNSDRYIYIS